MTNTVTAHRRHFEDLAIGEVIDLGRRTITADEIKTFAREFDPLPFHLDEKAAKASLLGGLAASGFQVGGFALRMLVDSFLNQVTSAGGLGFTDLKWKRPFYVGDTLTGTATIVGLRRSASNPAWGIVTLDFDLRNQRDEPQMSMTLSNIVELRHPDAPPAGTVAS